ncbi:MAG: hypothetical protein ACOC97_02065 [Myxococcota bacterium]
MGLLDLFSKDSGAKALKKHAARVANKRAQAQDRWESIRALGEMKTPEAVEALMVRFTYTVDPSITDQEEKDAAYEGVLAAGEAAVEPLRSFLASSDSIAWPLKALDRIVTPDRVVGELLALLSRMDTEYERDPQKKIQVLSALEERPDPRAAAAVRPFLEDMNETARFHAVGAMLAQSEHAPDEVRGALLEACTREDSTRVRARILDGFVERGWRLGDRAEDVRAKLPQGYAVTARGEIKRAAR